MKIEVRQLKKEDMEEIINLRILLQKVDFENDLGIEEKILENRTRKFLIDNLNKQLYLYGVFIGENLVSMCGLLIFSYFPQADDLSGKVGYITSVYTKEEYRKRGYQKKVFEKCIELGKEFGIRRFKLSTKNLIAMKMYKSAGFIEDEHAKKMRIEEV